MPARPRRKLEPPSSGSPGGGGGQSGPRDPKARRYKVPPLLPAGPMVRICTRAVSEPGRFKHLKIL